MQFKCVRRQVSQCEVLVAKKTSTVGRTADFYTPIKKYPKNFMIFLN